MPKLDSFADESPWTRFSLPPMTNTPMSKPSSPPFRIVTPVCPAVLSMPTSQYAPSGQAATHAPSPLTVWPFRSRVMLSAPMTIPLFGQFARSAVSCRVGGDRVPAAHMARTRLPPAGNEHRRHRERGTQRADAFEQTARAPLHKPCHRCSSRTCFGHARSYVGERTRARERTPFVQGHSLDVARADRGPAPGPIHTAEPGSSRGPATRRVHRASPHRPVVRDHQPRRRQLPRAAQDRSRPPGTHCHGAPGRDLPEPVIADLDDVQAMAAGSMRRVEAPRTRGACRWAHSRPGGRRRPSCSSLPRLSCTFARPASASLQVRCSS